MSDLLILLLATHAKSFAAVNIHGLEELFLAIHALELDISVTAGSRIVFFVLVASFKNFLRLLLQLLDL